MLKTYIQPWYARASIRMNCENANGMRANGSRGSAVKKVGKWAWSCLYVAVSLERHSGMEVFEEGGFRTGSNHQKSHFN